MLCCLFFPKMYIIYFQPENNVKRLTMNKNITTKQKFAQLIKQSTNDVANTPVVFNYLSKTSTSTNNEKSLNNICSTNSIQNSTENQIQSNQTL